MSDWNPGPKYQAYLRRIDDLLTDEKRTVRDVYYALEARGFEDELYRKSREYALSRHHDDPEKHPHPDDVHPSEWQWEFEYQYVKRAVKLGRRHGYIDPALIVDSSRRAETTMSSGHGDAQQFIDDHVQGIWNRYRENIWDDQDTYVEVWLEKQSLASVFKPICDEWNVRLEATRGDWSDSKVYEATQRLIKRLDADDDIVILYFGDFNPSGYHAPVSIQETMSFYGIELNRRDPDGDSKVDYFDVWPYEAAATFNDCDGSLKFERKAINLDHIERFDLPENPNPSSTDKDRQLRERFQRQVSDGRDVNVELNALKEYHREFLEDLIRDSITQYIDEEVLAETQAQIENQREEIQQAVSIDESVIGE